MKRIIRSEPRTEVVERTVYDITLSVEERNALLKVLYMYIHDKRRGEGPIRQQAKSIWLAL